MFINFIFLFSPLDYAIAAAICFEFAIERDVSSELAVHEVVLLASVGQRSGAGVVEVPFLRYPRLMPSVVISCITSFGSRKRHFFRQYFNEHSLQFMLDATFSKSCRKSHSSRRVT